ncbi:hypothetical protein D3C80_1466770 [compost metagenome]
MGITATMILKSSYTLPICEAITTKRTTAMKGTGSHAVNSSDFEPLALFLAQSWAANARNNGTIIKKINASINGPTFTISAASEPKKSHK